MSSNSSTLNCTQSNANSTECQVYFQHQNDIAFATSLIVNAILFTVFFTLFVISRLFKRHRAFYEPNDDVAPVTGNAVLGWALSAWRVSDDELVQKRGLDALVYIKFLGLMFWLIVALNVYGWIVLVPVHATAGGNKTGISQIGMGNVPQGSAALTADLIGMWLNGVLCCVAFFILFRLYTKYRLRYRAREAAENYVVLVREFPREMAEQQLFDVFDSWFPGRVAWVRKAFKTDNLWKELELRQKVGVKLEQAQAANIESARKGKDKRVTTGTKPTLFLCGPKADAEEFFTTFYAGKSEEIRQEQALVSSETVPAHAAAAAFVCFRDMNLAKVVSSGAVRLDVQSMYSPIQESWVVDPAPAPGAVIWPSLPVPHLQRWVRSLVVNVIIFFLIFFWMIPVAFASSLANLQTLSTVLPFLVPLLDVVPVVKGFIQGFLPGLVLIIFFAILVSLIITPLAKAEAQWDQRVIVRSVYNKYWLFLIFNIFLGSILASGFFNVMGEIIQNPSNIVQLLATSLPNQVIYFTTYVMIASLSQFSLQLWNPGSVISSYLLGCCKKTKRDKRGLYQPTFTMTYAANYAFHCLIFMLCIVFSVLNPLILPFGVIYYGLAYIVHRYQIVYLYTPADFTEGAVLPSVFSRLCWSVVLFMAANAGILGLALFPAAASLFVGCVLVLFFWGWTKGLFYRPSRYGTVDYREVGDGDPFFKGLEKSQPPASQPYLYYTLRDPVFVLEDQVEHVEELMVEDGAAGEGAALVEKGVDGEDKAGDAKPNVDL